MSFRFPRLILLLALTIFCGSIVFAQPYQPSSPGDEPTGKPQPVPHNPNIICPIVEKYSNEIATLEDRIAELKMRQNLSRQQQLAARNNLYQEYRAEQEKSASIIRGIKYMIVFGLIAGWITCFTISRRRISRYQQQLSEEQQSLEKGTIVREALEQKLHRMQRLESLGMLAGGVAHDFNNLLVGVMGNAELLKLKTQDSDPFVVARVDQILRSAEKAASLSYQMLAYAGKRQIARSHIDLNELVSRMIPILESTFGKQIELKAHYWRLPLICEIDETQIEQVLMNLVSNAVDASSVGSTIIIRTGCESLKSVDASLYGNRTCGGSFNYVEVEDNGTGISDDAIERMFEPFYSGKQSGRGLGLAVVYGMVNAHEGLIRTKSQVNIGSAFRVLLPTALESIHNDLTVRQSVSFVNSSMSASLPTILLVDDDEAVCDLIKNLFQALGWQVLVANDGKQGLEIIENQHSHIRCVLLDIVMPEMGGCEVLSRLQASQIALPVILMSGFSQMQLHDLQQELQQESDSETQVVAILEKPFRIDEVLAAVEQATGVREVIGQVA